MDEVLRLHPGVVVSAIAGMGGLGKTELAVQYVTRHLADYPGGICWLNGRVGDLAAQVVQLVTRELELEVPQELRGRPMTVMEQVEWCWDRWVPAGAVLVVLDDVATWEAFAPIAPKAPRFRVLMTTREQNLARQFPSISLDVLPLQKALELLGTLERCGRMRRDRTGAEALCELVGRLPLGIELVGRYLANDRFLTFSEMAERLRQKGLKDPAYEKVPNAQMTAQFGVRAAFELTWERLEAGAQRVARLLGYFALDVIPWAVVEGMMRVCEGEAYEIRLMQTVLDNASLVQVDEESLETCRLHPLIQQFVREKEVEHVAETRDRGLYEAFTSEMLAIARKITRNPPTTVIREVEEMKAHLEELAKHWTERLEGDDLRWAFVGVARFYKAQGLYSRAETWYENCLAATKSRFEGDHADVALSLNNLACLYESQGRLSEAEPLYLQSLGITQRLFEGDHPSLALSLNNLAALYRVQGRLSEAEPLYLRSLKMKQRLFKDNHADVALSLNNLASLYESQGRLSEAEPLLLRSLEMKQQLFEGDHADVALSLNNLAMLYRVQGRLSEAEPLLLRSLEMKQRLFEDDHPSVALSLSNVGLIRLEQGRLKEAEALLVQAFEMRQRIFGDQHPDTQSTLEDLQYVRSQM